MLIQYHLSDDGRVAKGSQVKLSVPLDVADRGIQSIVWAGTGILAAATEEKNIRIFDLVTDESYNLSLNSLITSKYMDKNDKVVQVAFNPIDRYLAVGTLQGVVIIWRYNGSPRDFKKSSIAIPHTTANDWEVIIYIYTLTYILMCI